MKNFDENKNKILEHNPIQIELADLAPTLARIRAATTDSTKTPNDGFKMPPPQYFDQFFDNLNQNLEENLIKNLPKSDGFKTPDAYFDNLANRILERQSNPQKIVLAPRRNWTRWAMGAAAAALVGTAIVSFLWSKNDPIPTAPTVAELPKTPPPSIQNPVSENRTIDVQNSTKKVDFSTKIPQNVENLPKIEPDLNLLPTVPSELATVEPRKIRVDLTNMEAELDKILDEWDGEPTELLETLNLTDEELELVAEESEGF